MKINKDELKLNLTIEQIQDLVDDFGGDSKLKDNNTLICKTICHCGNSHKLYYYENTHLFRCYTDCDNTWDVFELVRKVKSNETNTEWSLPKAIGYVASYFGYSPKTFDFEDLQENLQDWDVLKKYEAINMIDDKQRVELKTYDDSILRRLPHPRVIPWESEGILPEVIRSHNICYDPVSQGIVIPHYDIDNRLIGIRERTLIKEDEVYGKYRPAYINGQLFNHPLSFALYNLNNSKDNIHIMKKAIVFEGEKGCLMYPSYFGEENDISVACCGSSLITYQVKLLLSLGVTEIVIAFDKQFQKIGDDEFKRWTKKLKDIHKKYSPYVTISFMFDRTGTKLQYKDSPIDRGKEVFLELFKERIFL